MTLLRTGRETPGPLRSCPLSPALEFHQFLRQTLYYYLPHSAKGIMHALWVWDGKGVGYVGM